MRKMLNHEGERTLISTIIPLDSAHINGILGISLNSELLSVAVNSFSLPFDFYVKASGKSNINSSLTSCFPIFDNETILVKAKCRGLLLNCLTSYYSYLWKKEFDNRFCNEKWSKNDLRLGNGVFNKLQRDWSVEVPLRSDYMRRQALVEIDVLISLALGMTLNQLKTMYRIQFPLLQSHEDNTWYDSNGRIVFTNNLSLTNIGFSRQEWENENAVIPIKKGDSVWNGIMKDAPAGYVFSRTITDDTMPGGPIERTIEYVAPFDKCDREKDYEIAWKFFEEKYNS